MARIPTKEFNQAELNNYEKLNGDYFLKTIQADSDGNFISPFVPAEYDEITLTYIAAGNGAGKIHTVGYKLDSVLLSTLTLTYDASNRLVGVSKA
jgi:hypothetical protein